MRNKSEYDIVILTTSIDRLELHNEVFKNTFAYIDGLKCKWFVTINNVNNRVEETVQNYKKILSKYDVTIQTYDTGGTKMDFMHSCERLSKFGHECVPKIGYFWLEDDWMINSDNTLMDDLEDNFNVGNSYVSLANRDELSFNPGIWSINLFDSIIYKPLQDAHLRPHYGTQQVLNPERVCTYPVDKTRKIVDKYKKVSRYHDVGRNWQTKNLKGIQSWKLV